MNNFEYTAPDGMQYNTPQEYVWISVLGFCGCYDDNLFDLTFSLLERLYQQHKTDWGIRAYQYEGVSSEFRQLQELLLHVFDSKEITEHGGSVRGSWLTEKGLDICENILKYKVSE